LRLDGIKTLDIETRPRGVYPPCFSVHDFMAREDEDLQCAMPTQCFHPLILVHGLHTAVEDTDLQHAEYENVDSPPSPCPLIFVVGVRIENKHVRK
jgi:hypothetical protein